ncbi:hypothetical protein AGMMS49982_16780 [Bacteroidia bacterium]|nr:hypothetical protein AGMMS49982_16780 [Bacteroidia bacterium]
MGIRYLLDTNVALDFMGNRLSVEAQTMLVRIIVKKTKVLQKSAQKVELSNDFYNNYMENRLNGRRLSLFFAIKKLHSSTYIFEGAARSNVTKLTFSMFMERKSRASRTVQ